MHCCPYGHLHGNFTFSRLDNNFSRQYVSFGIFFSYFFLKIGFGISCKLSPWRQFAWKVKACFLGQKKKNIINIVTCWICPGSGRGWLKQSLWEKQFVCFFVLLGSLTYRADTKSMDNYCQTLQREIMPKVRKAELSFLYATCRLVLFYISTKYHKNIPKGLWLTERTQN